MMTVVVYKKKLFIIMRGSVPTQQKDKKRVLTDNGTYCNTCALSLSIFYLKWNTMGNSKTISFKQG